MSSENDEAAATESGKIAKFALIGAFVAGGACAFVAACSAWKRNQNNKRPMNESLPGAVDECIKAFKAGFLAVGDGNCVAENTLTPHDASVDASAQMPANEHESGHAHSKDVQVHNGFAYGTGADGPQWFVAKWHDATESSVRVEYISALDVGSSDLLLPSSRKTTIARNYVRKDAPADRFEPLKNYSDRHGHVF